MLVILPLSNHKRFDMSLRAQCVCATKGVRVSNYTESLSTGRALATLISHYLPDLIAPGSVLSDEHRLVHE